MDNQTILAAVSMIVAGVAVALGSIGPALAQGRSVASPHDAMARQPDLAERVSRTLFIGLAMIESLAIYCLVVALILLFANPFTSKVAGPP